MKIFLKKNHQLNQGYTIIETMISISLFLVIIMSGMSALLNANLIHQKSQNMRSIMDSLSFIMEDVGRNLRTGSTYYCVVANDTLLNIGSPKSGQNCRGIAFEPTNGNPTNNNDQWIYFLVDGGKITKSDQGSSGLFIQLTPDEVVIDTTASAFSVSGAEPPPGDSQQPFVTIRLVGSITLKGVVSPFSLQTSVSQRLIDI